MNPPTLEDLEWLVGPEAIPFLDMARKLRDQNCNLVNRIKKLREHLSPPRSSLVIEQIELRVRASSKFANSERMFFQRIALEQASGQAVARYKANRLPEGQSKIDLCCGIGGDALALSQRGEIVAVDRDPGISVLALANLKRLAAGAFRVLCEDATRVEIERDFLWHIDPDRRAGQQRTTQVTAMQPSDRFIDSIRRHHPDGCVKLAPATEVPEAWRRESEREWIGHDGECKQQVVWFGALTKQHDARSATILDHSGHAIAHVTTLGVGDLQPEVASEIGAYLFEPHAAMIAARLVDHVAARLHAHRVHPVHEYLTGNRRFDGAGVACFAVREILPLDMKRIRSALRNLKIGHLEIKKRGVSAEVQRQCEKLKMDGEKQATLILTKTPSSHVAVLCERLSRS